MTSRKFWDFLIPPLSRSYSLSLKHWCHKKTNPTHPHCVTSFMHDPYGSDSLSAVEIHVKIKKLISTVNCNARFQFIDSFKLNDKCGHKISWFWSLINFIGYEKTWQIKWSSILLLQAIFSCQNINVSDFSSFIFTVFSTLFTKARL